MRIAYLAFCSFDETVFFQFKYLVCLDIFHFDEMTVT